MRETPECSGQDEGCARNRLEERARELEAENAALRSLLERAVLSRHNDTSWPREAERLLETEAREEIGDA